MGSWSSIPGWFDFAATYDVMVGECPDGGEIVEVGVAFGRSVAYLARRVIESRKNITIWAIDPWREEIWGVGPGPEQPRQAWGGNHSQMVLGEPFSAFIACMTKHAPEELERINVCRCTSADAAKFIGPCFGVFIDADHSHDAVWKDIELWRPRVVPGGILAGDDYSDNFPGVQRAVREAFGEFEVHGTTWIKRL